jgi:hypothetical protein
MKTVTITIEVPLPDEGTQEDAETLAKIVERLALTTNPSPPGMYLTSRVYGKVVKVKLHNKLTH